MVMRQCDLRPVLVSFLILVALCAISGSRLIAQRTDATVQAHIDRVVTCLRQSVYMKGDRCADLAESMASLHVTGISIAVIHNGRLEWARGFGTEQRTHIQPFVVRKATGDDARRGDAGESLIEGETGSVATNSGLRAYVGVAPDVFAANTGFRTLMTAFYEEQRYDGDAFLHQQNPFAKRNVTAIVLEVPNELIGKGKINAWATISLFGHAPEVQVSRWGLPMVTHLFLNDPGDQDAKEQFNASVPSEDIERFAKSIADVAEKMTTYAGSAADPSEYGKLIAARLCPDTLPYELGTSAAFELANFNGRALGDDVLDVMLTLATNTTTVDGLAPDRGRIRKNFPYYGAPYTAEEQVGVRPMPRPTKK
jgi:hypothetical protein